MYHFIHIPKNGGMTIRHNKGVLLSNSECLPTNYYNQMIGVMKKNKEHTGTEHARWRDLKPEIQQTRKFFAIVRNPWSRVVSRYTFLINNVVNNPNNKNKVGLVEKTFEEFLKERHSWCSYPFYWHRVIRNWYNQKDYVTDTKGKQHVTCLRTEHLNSDYKEFFNKELKMHPRNVSNTKKLDYKTFYTPETIQIIADWYKDDIDYFGFDFDTPATRNINV